VLAQPHVMFSRRHVRARINLVSIYVHCKRSTGARCVWLRRRRRVAQELSRKRRVRRGEPGLGRRVGRMARARRALMGYLGLRGWCELA
jgi:hypothetical protein